MRAALSPDGETVACCARAGEVTLWDVASGRCKGVLTGDFAMVEALHFADNGAAMLLKETYGRWGLYCFDVQRQRTSTNDNGHPPPTTTDIHKSEFSYKSSGTFPTDDKWLSSDAGLHDLRPLNSYTSWFSWNLSLRLALCPPCVLVW